MIDVYEQLRESLDRLGIGFPTVPDVDVAYLRKLFTEVHARMFMAMENKFQQLEECEASK